MEIQVLEIATVILLLMSVKVEDLLFQFSPNGTQSRKQFVSLVRWANERLSWPPPPI